MKMRFRGRGVEKGTRTTLTEIEGFDLFRYYRRQCGPVGGGNRTVTERVSML